MFLEWIEIFKTYKYWYVYLYMLISKYVCIYMCVCICINIDIWISEYMNYQIIMWYFNKSILTYVSFLYSFLCPRKNHFQISWLIFVSLHIFEQYSYISRVPWTARRSNQSIRKEISPGCSLEGLMLKLNTLATWCEELTHWKRPWCWERLRAEGEGEDRG